MAHRPPIRVGRAEHPARRSPPSRGGDLIYKGTVWRREGVGGDGKSSDFSREVLNLVKISNDFDREVSKFEFSDLAKG